MDTQMDGLKNGALKVALNSLFLGPKAKSKPHTGKMIRLHKSRY